MICVPDVWWIVPYRGLECAISFKSSCLSGLEVRSIVFRHVASRDEGKPTHPEESENTKLDQ